MWKIQNSQGLKPFFVANNYIEYAFIYYVVCQVDIAYSLQKFSHFLKTSCIYFIIA
jgi:hypothetical protein